MKKTGDVAEYVHGMLMTKNLAFGGKLMRDVYSQVDPFYWQSCWSEAGSVEKTLIKEFPHRVCISLEPVAECRRGFKSEKTSTKKIRFTCMPRHSTNARRFLKESREQSVLGLADFTVSHVEAVKSILFLSLVLNSRNGIIRVQKKETSLVSYMF